MKNKIKTLVASVLTTVAFIAIGYKEVGAESLLKAAGYAVIISLPIMLIAGKYKRTLLKAPKYMTAVGMIIGTLVFKGLYEYNKVALSGFGILVGILFIFFSLVYTDEELNES